MASNEGGVMVKKCGVSSKKNSLIIAYQYRAQMEKRAIKYRIHSIPMGKYMRVGEEPGDVLDRIKEVERHAVFLEQIPDDQLKRLVGILLDCANGVPVEKSIGQITNLDPDEDLNKLDSAVLEKKKQAMKKDFDANLVKPGDEQFEYDKQVDFEELGLEVGEWDDSNSGDDSGF